MTDLHFALLNVFGNTRGNKLYAQCRDCWLSTLYGYDVIDTIDFWIELQRYYNIPQHRLLAPFIKKKSQTKSDANLIIHRLVNSEGLDTHSAL